MKVLAKAPNALRTIREVADELGLETHVLRFWEKEFAQISPTQRSNGRRYYRPDDIATIRQIQSLLHDQGYTIKGARNLLDGKSDAVEWVQPDSQDQLAKIDHSLTQMRQKIADRLKADH